MNRARTFRAVVVPAIVLSLLLSVSAYATPHIPGAIFTTTVDGTIVNENVHYQRKTDVYLDGGPGPNAPPTAAGLPEGDYYFQVTDPSGRDLLSTDHISCRKIHVNEFGVISLVYTGTTYIKVRGQWTPVPCEHAHGIDVDHADLGAITVQLYPFDNTPNPGGVYKVWVTPVGEYAGDPDLVCSGNGKCNVNGEEYRPGYYHGFIPQFSKTDNFKVKKPGRPPEITVRKFHDRNLNGTWDIGEEEVSGWLIEATDPNGASAGPLYTPVLIVGEPSGLWTFVEDTPVGTLQTVSILDGTLVSLYPSADPTVQVYVAGTPGETHEVVYGNVGLGEIVACKYYDRDADGTVDPDEPGVAGWQIQLTGTDVTGTSVGPIVQYTGADGCTAFTGLRPGSYTVTELFPSEGTWYASGPVSGTFAIESRLDGSSMSGGSYAITFTNYCMSRADFGTKGYWHNRNGLQEITTDDIAYANSLPPYASPSSYFDAGDEPFDGYFADGTPVEPAPCTPCGDIAPAGSPLAEISHFLVDSNAGGDPREQLAQQLLAFIFNARHRLDNPGAIIVDPAGNPVGSAQSLIDEAVYIWQYGTDEEQRAMGNLLDLLNNNYGGEGVRYIHYDPCAVIYYP